MFNWLPALLLILAQGAMHQGGTEVRVNQWLAVVTAHVAQEHQFQSPAAPQTESQRKTPLVDRAGPPKTRPFASNGHARVTSTNLTRAFPLRAGPVA